jgi:hypothetical protein
MSFLLGPKVASLLVLSMAIGSMVSLGAPPNEEAPIGQLESSWTVMVYMAADVDDALPWEQDVNELEAAYQSEGMNVIVLLDPSDTGDSRLLKVEHDENYFDPEIVSTVLDDDGAVIPGGSEVNTGSPATLRDFIVYSSTQYPADNLALVMWGHGGGWRGLCPDGYDLLTIPELGSALLMVEEQLERGMDLLVLDICNGATLELAYEVREYADLLVASEVLVPSDGLPYMDVVNALASDTSQSPHEFADAILETYIDWAAYGSAYSTSMGVFDLGLVDDIVQDLDRLSSMGLGYDRIYHEQLQSAVLSSEFCEGSWYLDTESIGGEVSTRDLPAEMKHAALSLAESHQSVVVRYAKTVAGGVTDGTDIAMTSGLGLYASAGETGDEAYAELEIAAGPWDEFSAALRADRPAFPSGPEPVLETGDSPSDSDLLPDFLTLTWQTDDLWNYSSYLVHVFQVLPHGLVLCADISSSTQIVRVDGVVGHLLISASAFIGAEAYAHHTLTASLADMVRIDVSVELDDHASAEPLKAVVTLASGGTLVADCVDGTCTVYVVVPDQADVGETIRVELVDANDGSVLSERLIRITGEDIALSLSVGHAAPEGDSTAVVVGVMASVVLIGIAFVILANYFRRR